MTDIPLTYSIADVVKATGIGRTSIYNAIKAGQLRALKFSGRTLIRAEDLKAFIDSLQPLKTGK